MGNLFLIQLCVEVLPGYFCTSPNGYRQRPGFQGTEQEMLFPDPHCEEIKIVCCNCFLMS